MFTRAINCHPTSQANRVVFIKKIYGILCDNISPDNREYNCSCKQPLPNIAKMLHCIIIARLVDVYRPTVHQWW